VELGLAVQLAEPDLELDLDENFLRRVRDL
jgi:hypothetical protein